MTLLHIYDKETGKFMRSQEPKIDPLETAAQGHTVYCTYPNSTEVALPDYGEHEIPFFNVETQTWTVKGQYKNLEVYNTENKNFEYCYTDDLGENQVFIDDKEGIEKFKETYQKYIVNDQFKIVENPQYAILQQLNSLNSDYNAADTTYQNVLETPVQFTNGKMYKPKWIDDNTYPKILTGALAGAVQFPIEIWDATQLKENMVSMDQTTFGQLCVFLTTIQMAAFDTRKNAQDILKQRIAIVQAAIDDGETEPVTFEEGSAHVITPEE